MQKIEIDDLAGNILTINIEGTIGESNQNEDAVASYNEFKTKFDNLLKSKPKEIVVNIRSTGGNVNDAILIYEAIKGSNCQVTTKCWGYVASAATIIAQAASSGKRQMSANALYLIHNSTSQAQGNRGDIQRTEQLLEATDKAIATIYASRAERELEFYVELMSQNGGNGCWLDAKQAKQMGLIDQIIEPEKIENRLQQAILEMGLPPIPKNIKPSKTMTINEKWSAIKQIILLNETPENSQAVEEVQNQLLQTIEELQNKITQLEALNTKAKAQPTATKQSDDATLEKAKLSPNQQAYLADLKRIRG